MRVIQSELDRERQRKLEKEQGKFNNSISFCDVGFFWGMAQLKYTG